jgi:hypothetical protein
VSVHVSSWVWRHSAERLANRLVLLYLADCANTDGGGAYPAIETIAAHTMLSDRHVKRCLKELVEAGAIAPEGYSPRGTQIFRVVMDKSDQADAICPEVQVDAQDVTQTIQRRGHKDSRGGKSPDLFGEPEAHESSRASEAEGNSAAVEAFTILSDFARKHRRRIFQGPSLDGVERVCREFAASDPVQAAREAVFWLEFGRGAKRQSIAVTSTFRTFMRSPSGQKPAPVAQDEWDDDFIGRMNARMKQRLAEEGINYDEEVQECR